MLKGKKAIAIGDRDGIQGPALAACLEAAGAEVVVAITGCFVWTAAGAMEMAYQSQILEAAESNERGNLVVVLGISDVVSTEIAAETVTLGDPAFAGPLAGNSLNLPVYHVLDPEVREAIPSEAFESHVGIMETVLDGEVLAAAARKFRGGER